MASEISHVVYAARVLTNLGNQVREPDYWVGTLFPNIYQLGIKARHRLHPDKVSLYSLVAENDFMTGLRVHAWVDITRENYLRNHFWKERLPWNPVVSEALRLLEDDLLYDYFDDWDLVYRLLNKIDNDELNFISVSTVLSNWHKVIQNYIKNHPDDEVREKMLHDKGLTKAMAKETVSYVRKLRDLPAAQQLLEGFWVDLEDTLS